jgi:excisionase family DNA binding protein
MERAAFTIAQAAQAGAGSRSTIYEAINDGRLRARKRGRSTVILSEDLSVFLQSLPAIEPKPHGQRNGRSRRRP